MLHHVGSYNAVWTCATADIPKIQNLTSAVQQWTELFRLYMGHCCWAVREEAEGENTDEVGTAKQEDTSGGKLKRR